MTSPEIPKPSRRLLKRLLTGVALVIILILTGGYFLLGTAFALKKLVLPKLGKALNAEVTAQNGTIRPFSSLTLEKVTVKARGEDTILRAESLRARYHLLAILRGRIKIDELILVGPHLNVVQRADGRTNLDSLTTKTPKTGDQKEKGQGKGRRKEKEENDKPPGAPGRAKPPPQLDIGVVKLENAIVLFEKTAPDGSDRTELGPFALAINQLGNGRSGKIVFAGPFKRATKSTSPTTTNGLAEGSVSGHFEFTLNEALQPIKLTGSGVGEMSKAEGSLADLSGAKVTARADLSPTDIRELGLHFQRKAKTLGDIVLSGPFSLQAGEGDLSLIIRSIDRQLLNLAGSGQGLDFKDSTINSTNRLRISRHGETVAATGNINLNQFSLGKRSQNTPPADVRCQYDLAFERKRTVQIHQLQFNLSPQPGSNDLAITGHLDLGAGRRSPGELIVKSDFLDITPLYDLVSPPAPRGKVKGSKSRRKRAAATAKTEEIEPKAVSLPIQELTIDLRLKKFILRELALDNLSTRVALRNNKLSVDPLSASINGAPLRGTVQWDLGREGYQYDIQLTGDQIPIQPLVEIFSEESADPYQGNLDLQTALRGQGLTGKNLQKHLNGSLRGNLTNGNIQIVGPKIQNLLIPIATVLRLPELTQTPIHSLKLDAVVGDGKIDLKQFQVTAEAFQAASHGEVPLAKVFTNSHLNLPVAFSIKRSLAAKVNLAGDSPPDSPFVTLPDFLRLTGTLGEPKTKLDNKVIAGLFLKSASELPIGNEKTGAILEEVGGVLSKDKNARTNAPARQGTNTPLGNILDIIRKK